MTLRRMLKRLRLKQGDILLVRRSNDYHIIDRLIEAGRLAGIDADIPIVVVENFRDFKKVVENVRLQNSDS